MDLIVSKAPIGALSFVSTNLFGQTVNTVAADLITGKIKGVTYRVHWTLLLIFPFAWVFASSLVAGSLVAGSLLAMILAHELGCSRKNSPLR